MVRATIEHCPIKKVQDQENQLRKHQSDENACEIRKRKEKYFPHKVRNGDPCLEKLSPMRGVKVKTNICNPHNSVERNL